MWHNFENLHIDVASTTKADIHTNLNNALTKTSVTKALDKLTEKQLAFSKSYGKSIIYSITQVHDIWSALYGNSLYNRDH
jgi:predicted transcriptional regulator